MASVRSKLNRVCQEREHFFNQERIRDIAC